MKLSTFLVQLLASVLFKFDDVRRQVLKENGGIRRVKCLYDKILQNQNINKSDKLFSKLLEKNVYITKQRFVSLKYVNYLEKVYLHKRMRVKTSS